MKKTMSFLLGVVVVLALLVGCKSNEPAYMHPYGEGVDPDTVTTVPFQTRTTSKSTAPSETTATKKTLTTVPHGPVKLDIPEGYVVCPLCEGVLIVCDKCLGTTKMKAEILNQSTGIYVRKYIDCSDCAEFPGYEKCEFCENKLYVPE